MDIKGAFNIWLTSTIPTLSFQRSCSGDYSTLKVGSMVFGDLQTASWIEAAARQGALNIWQISPIPTLSFQRSRNGEYSTCLLYTS